MVIIDTVINTLFGGLTLDPAGMHCPSRGDAFVSSYFFTFRQLQNEPSSLSAAAPLRMSSGHFPKAPLWVEEGTPSSLSISDVSSNSLRFNLMPSPLILDSATVAR